MNNGDTNLIYKRIKNRCTFVKKARKKLNHAQKHDLTFFESNLLFRSSNNSMSNVVNTFFSKFQNSFSCTCYEYYAFLSLSLQVNRNLIWNKAVPLKDLIKSNFSNRDGSFRYTQCHSITYQNCWISYTSLTERFGLNTNI